jgi:hypothetical protein
MEMQHETPGKLVPRKQKGGLVQTIAAGLARRLLKEEAQPTRTLGLAV